MKATLVLCMRDIKLFLTLSSAGIGQGGEDGLALPLEWGLMDCDNGPHI